jgi:TPR repeat protein
MPRGKILPHLRNKMPRFPADAETLSPSDRLRQRIRMALAVGALAVTFIAIFPLYEHIMDRNDGSALAVTPCDRLAAHPDDMEKRAPGVKSADLDIMVARKACHRALERHPDDARTLYQLSRTYIEGADPRTGLRYLQRAVALGYAQGQYALAQMIAEGNQTEPNVCESARLFLAAARQRHFLAKVRFVNAWMDGNYKACGLDVTDAELTQMVSAARELVATPEEEALAQNLADRWSQH